MDTAIPLQIDAWRMQARPSAEKFRIVLSIERFIPHACSVNRKRQPPGARVPDDALLGG